ncbi:Zn clus domain containing protein [Pyrenophora teres f. teres]|uniref:Zn clus domain containing protein n=1 Tax=Pyrenophora teres f. teres TaxID=97479 RepID=A0A6S6W4R5_9PLEO|nr:Zn clus domain containing protein [Pyrenophora teres f. teres]
MQVPNMLAEARVAGTQRFPEVEQLIAGRHHDAMQSPPDYDMMPQREDSGIMDVYPSTETGSAHGSLSPSKQMPKKHVSFELLLPQSPAHKARLPMRVDIYPHDTTDSIITTVKNFYGLYERRGVIFEDRHGNTLIARFENFEHGMTIYVRVSPESIDADDYSPDPRQQTISPRRPRLHLDEAFQMLPPHHHQQAGSRSGSRHARQSHSPQPGRGRRSVSASKRMRPSAKSRANSSHGSFANGDDYSDSEGEHGSVTSSRRSRKEPLASAEISVDNIVEGGRRKRAKFDSSELPLFVPPQVPMTASLSSVSPQRRISGNTAGSPYSANQQTFSYSHPLPSPQSYGQGESSYLQGLVTPYSASSSQAQGYKSRARGSGQYAHYRYSGSGGALPTPDTTLASISVISDEDVARQLMRLGDASNFSNHRTSTSTLDDAFSGKADAASSSDESADGSDDDNELPPLPYMARGMHDHTRVYDGAESSGEDYEDDRDGSFKGASDEMMPDEHNNYRVQSGVIKARSVSSKSGKHGKPRAVSKSKSKVNGTSKTPMSPSSLPSQSRKASNASLNFQQQLGVDEEDLSSKPRCQRCRKSKKGCDRQRPCQRCKDAGISADGCVSEDEGNGRKGRYGRHMGVSVKKNSTSSATSMAPPPMYEYNMPMDGVHSMSTSLDKSKKRKR